MAAWGCKALRGKSGLHKVTVPGNARAGAAGKPAGRDGKRHREQTALVATGVRVKRWGKSPPRDWQQDRHGKPHREQCRIGIARGPVRGFGPGYRRRAALAPAIRVGSLSRAGNRRPRGMVIQGGVSRLDRIRLTGPPRVIGPWIRVFAER